MYDVNYFIEKFKQIPENAWCVGKFFSSGRHCAFGHCGVRHPDDVDCINKEAYHLSLLTKNNAVYVTAVNDGNDKNYQQSTPKQRILAALYDIRDKELSEANVMAVNKIVNEVVEQI